MSYNFTVGGLIVLGIVFWAGGQSATGPARHTYNLFLGVLLVSMVLLNWGTIGPLIIKKGGS